MSYGHFLSIVIIGFNIKYRNYIVNTLDVSRKGGYIMIENIFGIVNISKNYFLTKHQFEFAVKYVLDTKYDIEPSFLEVRIDYIQNEVVLVFKEEYADEIFIKIIGDKFSFNNVKRVKNKLLKDIFGDNFLSEKVVYNNLYNTMVSGITFTVGDDQRYCETYTQDMVIIDSPQVERINAQIKVLREKKMDVIRNNKR